MPLLKQGWKLIGLGLLAILSVIYALPNLYSENPALEISGPSLEQVQTQVAHSLNKAQVPFLSSELKRNQLLIRFVDADAQLKANDLLRSELGTQYTLALNLVPATPAWLTSLGASPMKQGLDLRGGIHLLLQVDVATVVQRRLDGLQKNVAQLLREHQIRYRVLRVVDHSWLQLGFRDPAVLPRVKALLSEHFPEITNTPEQHEALLHLSLQTAELDRIRQNTVEQTMAILRNRVNELGVGEAVVQQQGPSRVAVDLPGIQDAARAKQILGGTATLAFHLVDDEHDPEVAKRSGDIPLGSKLYTLNGQPILLHRDVVLSGDAITAAVSGFDSQSGGPSVNIQLGGGGEALFSRVTRENVGKRMAIVFVESKSETSASKAGGGFRTRKVERVISAPVIQSALGSRFVITGLASAREAKDLALMLRAGALPAAIYPVEERMVGPSLGKENIRSGFLSLEVGMALILITMLFYYRWFGVIANLALLLNLVMLVALLSLIDATLTLPGIAGIVLTVGMAVDANVLIYERIREELRGGMSAQAAIRAGYERAFATILDANVTTLIVGIVLFAVGTGAVKGFAITLMIGLLTSMLTGVTYTRLIVDGWFGRRRAHNLPIGI